MSEPLSTTDRPAYRDRFPCRSCGTGYLDCAQGAIHSLMCCFGCVHPERWTTTPAYTPDELEDMRRRAKA